MARTLWGALVSPRLLRLRGAFLCPATLMAPRAETDETAPQKERYLRAVEKAGTLTAGCKAARVSHNTIYQWREHDEAFSFAEQQARNTFADGLEAEAVRRAWGGVKKPVYQGGVLVGHIQEYSDTLLIFMLKAVRPEKYRERFDVTRSDQPLMKGYPEDALALLVPADKGE